MDAEELRKSILQKAVNQILNATRGINSHKKIDRDVIDLAQERAKRRGSLGNIRA